MVSNIPAGDGKIANLFFTVYGPVCAYPSGASPVLRRGGGATSQQVLIRLHCETQHLNNPPSPHPSTPSPKAYTAVHATINHRVGRVLSLFSSRRNLNSPTPLAAGECAPRAPPPHPLVRGEGTLACGRGVGGVPIPTRRHTLWCSVNISTLSNQLWGV